MLNTEGDPVVKLHYKNKKYLAAFAAANPKGKHRARTPTPSHHEEFEGHLIADDDDLGEDYPEHLYRIPENLDNTALADPAHLDHDDIEEFTDPNTGDIAESPTDVTMASPIPSPRATHDAFTTPVTGAHVKCRLDFMVPQPVARPRGDIAPTRAHGGVQRAEQLRCQPCHVTMPVNPDVFYRKNVQPSNVVSFVFVLLIVHIINSYL